MTKKLIAKPVPFSSVVGGGVTLHNEAGHQIGRLSLLMAAGTILEQKQLVEQLVEVINANQPERVVRHLKRGFEYDVLGEGEVQISAPSMGDGKTAFQPRCRVVEEGHKLVVYRAKRGGKIWLRYPEEFTPDRFEDVQS